MSYFLGFLFSWFLCRARDTLPYRHRHKNSWMDDGFLCLCILSRARQAKERHNHPYETNLLVLHVILGLHCTACSNRFISTVRVTSICVSLCVSFARATQDHDIQERVTPKKEVPQEWVTLRPVTFLGSFILGYFSLCVSRARPEVKMLPLKVNLHYPGHTARSRIRGSLPMVTSYLSRARQEANRPNSTQA